MVERLGSKAGPFQLEVWRDGERAPCEGTIPLTQVQTRADITKAEPSLLTSHVKQQKVSQIVV